MSNLTRPKLIKTDMDKTDISYVLELLTSAVRDKDWDAVGDTIEFLQEYLDDDGGPIELEE